MLRTKLISAVALCILILACAPSLPRQERTSVTPDLTVAQKQTLHRGWQHLWSNEYDQAVKAFNSLISPSQASPEALRGRGLAYWVMTEEDRAVSDLIRAIELQPDQAVSVVMRDFLWGQVLERRSNSLLLERASGAIANSGAPIWIRREGLSSQASYAAKLHSYLSGYKRYNRKMNWLKGWTVIGPFSNISGSGFDKEFIDEIRLASGELVDPSGTPASGQSAVGAAANSFNEKKKSETQFEQMIPDLPAYLGRASEGPYHGINNMPVHWYKPGLDGPAGILPLNYLNAFPNPVGYAWKRLDVQEAGDYLFAITKGGAIKVWLDGKLLLVDEQETYGNERHYLRLQLEAGLHYMLVKLAGEEERLVMRIALEQLSEAESHWLNTRGNSATLQELTQLPQWLEPVLPDPLLNQLGRAIDENPQDIEANFWLAYMLQVKGFPAAGLELLDKGKEQHPASTLLDYGRIFCLEDLEDQEAEVYRLIHEICDRDPTAHRARAILIAKLIDRESHRPAERELAVLKEQVPGWINTYLLRAKLHFSRGQIDDGFRVIDQAEAKYPDAPDLFQLQILRAAKHLEHDRYEQLLHKIGANGNRNLADRYLLKLEMDREQFEQARNRISRILAYYPANMNALLKNCMARLRQGDDEVLDYAADLLSSFPYDEGLLEFTQSVVEYYNYSLTDLTENENIDDKTRHEVVQGKRKAEKCLKDLYSWQLSINPSQYQIRKQLREIRGQAPVDEFIEAYDSYDLIREYEAANWRQETDAVFVLDDECRIFFADGAERRLFHSVIHVQTQGGVEDFINRGLAYNPLYDIPNVQLARVIRADGTIEDASLGGGYVTFTGLKPGDYVELKYTVNSFRSGWLNGEFWASFQVNSSMPSFETRFTEIHHGSLNPKVVLHNQRDIPLSRELISPAPGFTGTQIQVSRLAALAPETAMDDFRDVYCWVDVSTIRSWSEISRWYSDLAGRQTEVTPPIRAKAQELCAGLTAGQDTITVLADFVAREIEYDQINFHRSNYIPARAATTLKHGFGDCKDKSALLIALCRAVGIEARLVLNMSGYAGERPYKPSPRFDHAIVYFPEQDRYLDPTSDVFEVTCLPEHLYNTWALLVDVEQEVAKLQRLPSGSQQVSTSTMDLRLNGNGELELEGHLSLTGTNAALIRALLDIGTADVKLKTFGSLLNAWVPGLQVSSLDCPGLEDLSGPLELSYTGIIPIPAGEERRDLTLPWLFTHDFSGLESAKRNLILFHDSEAHANELNQELRFHTGSGLRVWGIPEDAQFTFGDARSTFLYRVNEGTLVCKRRDLVPDLKVVPDRFPEYRTFALGVLDKEREGLEVSLDVDLAKGN